MKFDEKAILLLFYDGMVIQAVEIKSQKSRVLLKFNGKGDRWDVWENKKINYESAHKALVLQTEDFEE